jgi:hypothetical protein
LTWLDIGEAFKAIGAIATGGAALWRSPAVWQGESERWRRDDPEQHEKRKGRDSYYAPIARLQENREFIGDLMAKRYAMRALFGDPAEEPFAR